MSWTVLEGTGGSGGVVAPCSAANHATSSTGANIATITIYFTEQEVGLGMARPGEDQEEGGVRLERRARLVRM